MNSITANLKISIDFFKPYLYFIIQEIIKVNCVLRPIGDVLDKWGFTVIKSAISQIGESCVYITAHIVNSTQTCNDQYLHIWSD